MKLRAPLVALLFAASWNCAVLPAAANSLSLAEYRQRLAYLETSVDSLPDHPELALKMESELPESESVTVDEREISVSYRELKGDLVKLARAEASQQPGLAAQIRSYVKALAAEAAAYNEPPPADQRSRARLEEILARREFKSVKPAAGYFDTWKARFIRWLSRVLGRLFRFSLGSRFGVMQVVAYGVAGGAIAMLLIWIVMRLRRPEEDLGPREIIPFSPSARGWRAWLGDARARAQQKDWRDAIHLAYWAAIAFLEEQGAWKPNRARTPREYLRLVGARTPQHPPLAALTRKFERVWYGGLPAGETDFQETVGELERLGCR